MKKITFILVLLSFLSFGCATTYNYANFKCSDCYNQDSVKAAVITLLRENYKSNYNYQITNFVEHQDYYFVICEPTNPLVRDGVLSISISKNQCELVKVYNDP